MKFLVLILLLCCPLLATEATIDETEKTVEDELIDIKDLMVNLEDRLHDDRYDKVVQNQGKLIEDRMAKLIKEIEDAENEKSKEEIKGKHKKKKSQKDGGDLKDDGESKPSTERHDPQADSKLRNRNEPAKVVQRTKMPWETKAYDDWAKLGQVKRDSITQSYHEALPSRWVKRIEAYFLSINAEEIDKLDKALKTRQKYLKQNEINDQLNEYRDLQYQAEINERFPLARETEESHQ